MSAVQSGSLKFATIDITSATTTVIVAAQAGFSIVVVSLTFTLSGTNGTAKFQDTNSTDLSGTFRSPSTQAAVAAIALQGDRNVPLLSTGKGFGLQVVTGGTPLLDGCLTYYLSDRE